MDGLTRREKRPLVVVASLGPVLKALRLMLVDLMAQALREPLRCHVPVAERPACRDVVGMFPAQQNRLDAIGQRVELVPYRLRIQRRQLRGVELAVLRLADRVEPWARRQRLEGAISGRCASRWRSGNADAAWAGEREKRSGFHDVLLVVNGVTYPVNNSLNTDIFRAFYL